ncbi:hypothetical protein FOB64_003624 [Candida albicans]|uniref:Uncharacterized protein n=1 Tax=Candida albicans TaxID=5476 RepID=A0A8H6C0D8_CANAX|nr:hypothetical protein FOB64_003624 [Candida albicans]
MPPKQPSRSRSRSRSRVQELILNPISNENETTTSNSVPSNAPESRPNSTTNNNAPIGENNKQQLTKVANFANNPHRIKLSNADIKIIMFFIIQIRPFKYLGNSGVTQANKWEEIRHKFMEYKRNSHETNFIVPTVRTLQRQLATAIKKAVCRRDSQRRNGVRTIQYHEIPDSLTEIKEDTHYSYNNISMDSTFAELETAVYELQELSNKIKYLKIQSNNFVAATINTAPAPEEEQDPAPIERQAQQQQQQPVEQQQQPVNPPPKYDSFKYDEEPNSNLTARTPATSTPTPSTSTATTTATTATTSNNHIPVITSPVPSSSSRPIPNTAANQTVVDTFYTNQLHQTITDQLISFRQELTSNNEILVERNRQGAALGDLLDQRIKKLETTLIKTNNQFKKKFEKLTTDHFNKINSITNEFLLEQKDLTRQIKQLFNQDPQNNENLQSRITKIEELYESLLNKRKSS